MLRIVKLWVLMLGIWLGGTLSNAWAQYASAIYLKGTLPGTSWCGGNCSSAVQFTYVGNGFYFLALPNVTAGTYDFKVAENNWAFEMGSWATGYVMKVGSEVYGLKYNAAQNMQITINANETGTYYFLVQSAGNKIRVLPPLYVLSSWINNDNFAVNSSYLLTHQGNGIFRVTSPANLNAGSYPTGANTGFRLGSANGLAIFGAYNGAETLVLGTGYNLNVNTSTYRNFSLTLPANAQYQFTLNASNIDTPSLTVTGPPLNSPASVSFSDTDTQGGKIGGTVTITKATSETDVTHYRLYFGSLANPKMQQIGADLAANGANQTVTINAGTEIPAGVTGLYAFTKNALGEMATGASLTLIDAGPPLNNPGAISFSDTDFDLGQVAGSLSLSAASDESDITHYAIYFASDSNGRLQKIGSDLAKGTASLTLANDTALPVGATQIAVYSKNASGEKLTTSAILTLVDRVLPLQAATTIIFSDTNLGKETLGGTLTIGKASDEATVQDYLLYWGSNATTKLATRGAFATLAKTGSNLSYSLAATSLPSGATHLLVFTRYTEEMTSGLSLPILDKASPVNGATSLSFSDTDFDSAQIASTLTIIAATTEVDVVDYVLYWGSSASAKLSGQSALATISKSGAGSYTYAFASNTALPSGATHLLVYTRNADGEILTPAALGSIDRVGNARGEAYLRTNIKINGAELGYNWGVVSIPQRFSYDSDTDLYTLVLENITAQENAYLFKIEVIGYNDALGGKTMILGAAQSLNFVTKGVGGDGMVTLKGGGRAVFTLKSNELQLTVQSTPAARASGLSFADTNNSGGTISGTLTISKASSEVDITDYVLYWGSSITAKLSGQNAIVALPKTGNDLAYTFTNQSLPANPAASHFLVFTRNSQGENNVPFSLAIVDAGPPLTSASSVTFSDANTARGVISGTAKIGRSPNESDIENYVLYWGADSNTKLSGQNAIQTFPKGDGSATLAYTFTSQTIPTNATHLLVYTQNANGEKLTSPASVALNDLVPRITFHYLRPEDDTESTWGLHIWGEGLSPESATGWTTPNNFTQAEETYPDGKKGRWTTFYINDGSKAVNFTIHQGNTVDSSGSFIPDVKGMDIWVVQGSGIVATSAAEALITLRKLFKAEARWISSQAIAWKIENSFNEFNYNNLEYTLYYDPEGQILIGTDGKSITTGPNGQSFALTDGGDFLNETNAAFLKKFAYLKSGHGYFRKISTSSLTTAQIRTLLTGHLVVAVRDKTTGNLLTRSGKIIGATSLQKAGVLDELYAYEGEDLGVSFHNNVPSLKLWAPSAKSVKLHVYSSASSANGISGSPFSMTQASSGGSWTGVWSLTGEAAWKNYFYLYEVEVFNRSTGEVQINRVTDPYSIGLSMNGKRSQIVDMEDPALKPSGWESHTITPYYSVNAPEDITLYELHVRDFSIFDSTVDPEKRGTFMAFAKQSNNQWGLGMRHLQKLAQSGLTHVHLLPINDIGSVNEDKNDPNRIDLTDLIDKLYSRMDTSTRNKYDTGAYRGKTIKEVLELIVAADPTSEDPQKIVGFLRDNDGFNWGYDPQHYMVPEGSYSTNPDGNARILELRALVQSLHENGLRVIPDVVFNHTYDTTIFNKIVPDYYYRLTHDGTGTTDSCCPDTASENVMFEKLVADALVRWAKFYRVDAFRFDLMGFLTKSTMQRIRTELDKLNLTQHKVDGPSLYLYGEGWEFGSLKWLLPAEAVHQYGAVASGLGIGTFNDRMRDASKGAGQKPTELFTDDAFITDKIINRDQLLVGLRGTLNDWTTLGGKTGYANDPQEIVNYTTAHDKATLWDHLIAKAGGTDLDRMAKQQQLGISLIAFAQGVPFFHAGEEILRSKSGDENSYNSGDWFNQLDFSYQSNYWKRGVPPEWQPENVHWGESGKPGYEPYGTWNRWKAKLNSIPLATTQQINATNFHFQEVLQIRQSSPLFRMRTKAEIASRVSFPGNIQNPAIVGANKFDGRLVVMKLDNTQGTSLDPNHQMIYVFFNSNWTQWIDFYDNDVKRSDFQLHPVLLNTQNKYLRDLLNGCSACGKKPFMDVSAGKVSVPPQTTLVYVVPSSGAFPTHAAETLDFTDADVDANQIAGVLNITKASDESNITHYLLYWGADANTKLANQAPIATLAKTSGSLNYVFASDTPVPTGAKAILVYTKKGYWEMNSGVGMLLPDLGAPPIVAAQSLSFSDTDSDANELGGVLNITKAANESNITHYVVYWGSNSSTKLTELATLAKTGANLSYTLPANTAIPNTATHLLVRTKNNGGEMSGGVSLAFVDKRPFTGPLVIHYYRTGQDYGTNVNDYTAFWGMHLWGDGLGAGEATSWTTPKPFNTTQEDDWGSRGKGKFFSITINDPSQTVNLITHKGNSSDVQASFVPNELGNQVWIVQGNNKVYASQAEALTGLKKIIKASARWVTRDKLGWCNSPTACKAADAGSYQYTLHTDPTGNLILDDDGKIKKTDGTIDAGIPLTFAGDFSSEPASFYSKFDYMDKHGYSKLTVALSEAQIREMLSGHVVVAKRNAQGNVVAATAVQKAGVMDELFAYSGNDLGVTWANGAPTLKLWAPSAKSVKLHVYTSATTTNEVSGSPFTMTQATSGGSWTGVWSTTGQSDWLNAYYLYEVQTFTRTSGDVQTNFVTDPYSISLSTNSKRSQIIDWSASSLKPSGWDTHTVTPLTMALSGKTITLNEIQKPEDITLYELHVRDFSIFDTTVPEGYRGTFKAFTVSQSNGMKHLQKLAQAGLTHIHLLPINDIASVNEDKAGRIELSSLIEVLYPEIATTNSTHKYAAYKGQTIQQVLEALSAANPASEEQQAIVADMREKDGFNWGYDPYHYMALEGSYSTNPEGSQRILEFRELVKSLHEMGLRVIPDVVFNHMYDSSVLDRVVPDYYYRLNHEGFVTNDSCCPDTASETAMFEKLMVDTLVQWVKQYKVDTYRFDLMGFLTKSSMRKLRAELDKLTLANDGVDGKQVYLYGEGWDFGSLKWLLPGEAVHQFGAVASNLGIGSFNDRMRDAVKGKGQNENELFIDDAFITDKVTNRDMVLVGLRGTLNDATFGTGFGAKTGYANDPQEIVNYTTAHDKATLWDHLVAKVGLVAGATDQAKLDNMTRQQQLGMSMIALAQGVPFFHAGEEILRSKSGDENTYNSGDWFNRMDFAYQKNAWKQGVPGGWQGENFRAWAAWKARLPVVPVPGNTQIMAAFHHFQDVLKIRKSSGLFRLPTKADIASRVSFPGNIKNNAGSFDGRLIVMKLSNNQVVDVDESHQTIYVLFNSSWDQWINFWDEDVKRPDFQLHPVLRETQNKYLLDLFTGASLTTDAARKKAFLNLSEGKISVPPQTTLVYLLPKEATANPAAPTNGVMMQYFHWYLPNDGQLWNKVKAESQNLANAGITALWLPPAYKGVYNDKANGEVGYSTYDLYDLGEFNQHGSIRTKYGTRAEYLAAISQAQSVGVQIYADVVLNHKDGANANELVNAVEVATNNRNTVTSGQYQIRAWTQFNFPGRGETYSAFKWNWQHFNGVNYDNNQPTANKIYKFQGKNWDWEVDVENGNYDYLLGADIDLDNADVVQELKTWGEWWLNTTGVDGFRLDAVKHIKFSFYDDWLSYLRSKTGKPIYTVGEYWTQDFGRLENYINKTRGKLALFDAPLHYNFAAAANGGGGYDMRNLMNNTLMRAYPKLAVTIVENHDTQSCQALQSPVQDWFKPLAYAFILLREEGYPNLFYADYYGASYTTNDGPCAGGPGGQSTIHMASHKTMLDKLLLARKNHGYGLQKTYASDCGTNCDTANIIGWTRLGDATHAPMAVLINDGPEGTKWMEVGKANTTFIDMTGLRQDTVTTDSNGWGQFRVNGGSLSVWIPAAVTANAGLTLSPVRGQPSEAGATAQFEVTLQAQPSTNVTLQITSANTAEGTVAPATLTFTPVNWNGLQTITVTGVDDQIADSNTSFNISLAATSNDTRYGMTQQITLVNLDNDTAGVIASKTTLQTNEAGNSETFTVRLNTQPTANVTLPLSSSNLAEATVSPASLTFTPQNWNGVQTVTVTGVNDDLQDGNKTIAIVLGAATSSDATYQGFNPADLTLVNIDDDTAGFSVTSPTGNTSEEGTSSTFGIRLNTQPTANVIISLNSSRLSEARVTPASLTFTPANWNAFQTVTVTGVNDDLQDGTQPYQIVLGTALSDDTNYQGKKPNDLPLANIDNDTAGLSLGPVQGQIREDGASASFTVRLNSQPTANVTLPLSSSNTAEATVFPQSLTFTPVNWNGLQTVTITGVNDNIRDGNQSLLVILGVLVSSDSNYSGQNPPDLSVINLDDDIAGITVTPISGPTKEDGSSATLSVRLNTQPTANVTLPLSSSNPGEGRVTPASLTFTPANWNGFQVVTVSGVDDSSEDGNQEYKVLLGEAISSDANYQGLKPNDVLLSNLDDDSSNFIVSPITGRISEEGSSATFTVRLTSQPRSNVSLSLGASKPEELGIAPGTVTFTASNWQSPQTVTLTGKDDNVLDGDQAIKVTLRSSSSDSKYNALRLNDLEVVNLDNDTAGFIVSPLEGRVTEAGGAARFSVRLRTQPLVNVTLAVTHLNATEALVSPGSLTFTLSNWNAPQTVTITGIDDEVQDGDQPLTIKLGPVETLDLNYRLILPEITTVNVDNESPSLVVSPLQGQVTESGGKATFAVRLNGKPTAKVSVPILSSDTAQGTVSPALLEFTSLNWNAEQIVTITGIDDNVQDGNHTFRVTIGAASSSDLRYNGLQVPELNISSLDNDTAGFELSPIQGSPTEGQGSATFMVRLTTQPSANVTLPLNSSNIREGLVIPNSLIFTPQNWNAPQTVTVRGQDDPLQDGDQPFTVIFGRATSSDVLYNGLKPADLTLRNQDNDTAGFEVSRLQGSPSEDGETASFSVRLKTQPTASVTLNLKSSNPNEVRLSTSSLNFTVLNWQAPQEVTLTGVNDDVQDGGQNVTIELQRATSSDANYNGLKPEDLFVINRDNDSAGFSLSVVSGPTGEDGTTATFSVKLNTQPATSVTLNLTSSHPREGQINPVTLIFTPANWSAAQVVTTTGQDDDVQDGDQTYRVVLGLANSGDPLYHQLNAGEVLLSNRDNDIAGFIVSPVSGEATEEGGKASFTVRITTQPTAEVTISLTSSNLKEALVSPASLTFTSLNWKSVQTVTVTGQEDSIQDGNQPVKISFGRVNSSDLRYLPLTLAEVTLANRDNDTAGFLASAGQGELSEDGSQASLSLRLTTQPTANVTLGFSVAPTREASVNLSSLTFTPQNWNLAQTITLSGKDDAIQDGPQVVRLIFEKAVSSDLIYQGLSLPNVNFLNRDNDTAGITLSALSGSTNENGSKATFSVRLNAEPQATVTLNLSSSAPLEASVSPASLNFTPQDWSQPQTVTITGLDDSIRDGDQSYKILLAAPLSSDANYSGLTLPALELINGDNDTAGLNLLALSETVTEEGGQAEFQVTLKTQPLTSVTLTLTTSDSSEGRLIEPASSTLTFNAQNWNTPQKVTVQGLDDSQQDGTQRFQIILTSVSGDRNYDNLSESLSFSNRDNESNQPPQLVLNPQITANEKTQVILDGSASSDPDGSIVEYEWTQVSGPAVTLLQAKNALAFLETPEVESIGATLVFRLKIFDNGGLSTLGETLVQVRDTVTTQLGQSIVTAAPTVEKTLNNDGSLTTQVKPNESSKVSAQLSLQQDGTLRNQITVESTTGTTSSSVTTNVIAPAGAKTDIRPEGATVTSFTAAQSTNAPSVLSMVNPDGTTFNTQQSRSESGTLQSTVKAPAGAQTQIESSGQLNTSFSATSGAVRMSTAQVQRDGKVNHSMTVQSGSAQVTNTIQAPAGTETVIQSDGSAKLEAPVISTYSGKVKAQTTANSAGEVETTIRVTPNNLTQAPVLIILPKAEAGAKVEVQADRVVLVAPLRRTTGTLGRVLGSLGLTNTKSDQRFIGRDTNGQAIYLIPTADETQISFEKQFEGLETRVSLFSGSASVQIGSTGNARALGAQEVLSVRNTAYALNVSAGVSLRSLPIQTTLRTSELDTALSAVHSLWVRRGANWVAYSPIEALKQELQNKNVGSLTLVEPGEGFWVVVESATTLSLSDNQEYDLRQLDRFQSLPSGWSLLGTGQRLTMQEITTAQPQILSIWRWRNQQWQAYSAQPAMASALKSSPLLQWVEGTTAIEAGEAVWIQR